jgi:hypothetical protein
MRVVFSNYVTAAIQLSPTNNCNDGGFQVADFVPTRTREES